MELEMAIRERIQERYDILRNRALSRIGTGQLL